MFLKAQAIDWRENRPLTWADFKGKPDRNSGAAAVTYWNTVYTYKVEFRDCVYDITFNIRNVFDAQSSWVLWKSINNEYLLGHEQLHFDINELFTRKLAIELKTMVYTSNFKNEIDSIYNANRAECTTMEAQYDTETKHSNNSNMQYRWELFIYLDLKSLPSNY